MTQKPTSLHKFVGKAPLADLGVGMLFHPPVSGSSNFKHRGALEITQVPAFSGLESPGGRGRLGLASLCGTCAETTCPSKRLASQHDACSCEAGPRASFFSSEVLTWKSAKVPSCGELSKAPTSHLDPIYGQITMQSGEHLSSQSPAVRKL